uniref:Ribosomal protein S8 n=1 Tax=Haplomitrium hookeri TaxID=37406 RepID=A0A4Y5WY48_HAPHO|nr:ribosomal protein S8 [Haplomitrium hookeri]QDE12949.1 ribosomal protein S8 [Haplomitrium hookeri]
MHTSSNPLSSAKNAQKARKRVLSPSGKRSKGKKRSSACKITPRVSVSRLCWNLCRISHKLYPQILSGRRRKLGNSLKVSFFRNGCDERNGNNIQTRVIYPSKNRSSKQREGLGRTILSTSEGNLVRDREAQKTAIFVAVRFYAKFF